MDLQSLFDRLLQAVDEQAYLTPSDHADPAQQRALAEIAAALQAPGFRAGSKTGGCSGACARKSAWFLNRRRACHCPARARRFRQWSPGSAPGFSTAGFSTATGCPEASGFPTAFRCADASGCIWRECRGPDSVLAVNCQ